MVERVPMTREGYEQLSLELKRLQQEERPRVIQAIAEARAHGDLSENAEYHAAKEQQSFVEGRIRLLQDKLGRAQVIDTSNLPNDRVVFGATVLLEDCETGERVRYRIVGADEADIEQGKISVNSPVGRALIGHALDDAVKVKTPAGIREFSILEISIS
ncbi:MAG TPA: transcription elongation factor GreA [bacterium]|nr:transcription elongation factor GreA [bacterium]